MSKKYLFEIPENPDSIIFYPGREINIDGKTTVEVDRTSACAEHLMSDAARTCPGSAPKLAYITMTLAAVDAMKVVMMTHSSDRVMSLK